MLHHMDTYFQAVSIQIQYETPAHLPCPLCHNTISSLRRYHKHVAQHLEQLALFVIPTDLLENEDDGDSESGHDENRKY